MKRGRDPSALPSRSVRLRYLLLGASLLITACLLIICTAAAYRTASDIMFSQTDKINRSNVLQISNKVTMAVSEMERAAGKLRGNGELLELLAAYADARGDVYQRIQIAESVNRMLSDLQDIYPNLAAVNIVSPDRVFTMQGRSLGLTDSKYRQSSLYKYVLNAKNDIFLIESGYRDDAVPFQSDAFTFCTTIKIGDADNALLMLAMADDWMAGILSDNTSVVLGQVQTGQVIWADSATGHDLFTQVAGQLSYASSPYLYRTGGRIERIYHQTIHDGRWIVLIEDNGNRLEADTGRLTLIALLSALISLLICLTGSLLFSRLLLKPIHDLIRQAQYWKPGEPPAAGLRRRRRHISLKRQILAYLLIITMLPLLLNTLLLYFSLSEQIRNRIHDELLITAQQTRDNLDAFLKTNARISKSIILENSLRAYLITLLESPDLAEDYTGLRDNVQKAVDENMILGDAVFDTALYDQNGIIRYSTSVFNTEPLDAALLARIAASRGEPVWLYPGTDRFNRPVVRLFRKVIDDGQLRNGKYRFQTLGYICITYQESTIRHQYDNLLQDYESVSLLDSAGQVFSSRRADFFADQDNLAGLELTESVTRQYRQESDGLWLWLTAGNAKDGWHLLAGLPTADMRRQNWQMVSTSAYIFLGSLVPLLLIALYLASRIEKVVLKLIGQLEQFGRGELSIAFSSGSGLQEIEQLSAAFNQMSAQINELIDTVYQAGIRETRLRAERREADLVALRAQINPHFLYNTLESLHWLVRGGNKANAAEMIAALADFLRAGVHRRAEFITFQEELAVESHYLHIHEMRLGDRLRLAESIDGDVLGCRVPSGILQPLLENAIQHGIQEKIDGGLITIGATIDQDNLLVTLEDDGPGIEPARLADISARLAGTLEADSIGIYNVQKRLQLYYGPEYGLSISNRPEGGTRVLVRMPAVRGD